MPKERTSSCNRIAALLLVHPDGEHGPVVTVQPVELLGDQLICRASQLMGR